MTRSCHESSRSREQSHVQPPVVWLMYTQANGYPPLFNPLTSSTNTVGYGQSAGPVNSRLRIFSSICTAAMQSGVGQKSL